jgi:ribonuclease BN (tRNA processing enzyme)
MLDPSTRSRLFELTFLGTSSGRPTPARNVSSLALRIGRAHRLALFDAGEGTLRQLARCNHLSLSTLTCVFITHLHGDHVWGLCPLLSLASQAKSSTQRPSPLEAGAVPRTMHVFGPRGIAAFVKTNLAATHTWLGRPVLFHELLSHDVRPDSLPQEEDVVYHQSRTFAQPSMQMSVLLSYDTHTLRRPDCQLRALLLMRCSSRCSWFFVLSTLVSRTVR